MKNIKSLTLIIAFVCFFLSTVSVKAQTKKISKENVPVKVKETLKHYKNYTFEDQATLSTTSSLKKGSNKTILEKVYRFKFKGNRSGEILVINENGKVVALETGEPNK